MSKNKTYLVRLYGTLPCSAQIEVEAEDEYEAIEKALEDYQDADWDGADYSRPDGASVGVASVKEV